MATDAITREQQVTRGIRLEYLTIGWNVLEAIVAIVAGTLASSIALVGFGVDSLIETFSGLILLWRLKAEQAGKNIEVLERRALKLVGMSFLVLAAYVGLDAVKTLWTREQPERTLVGIVVAVLSLIVMPALARAKRKAAADLNSNALAADSKQTSICAYLSAILLGGLGLHALFGWWWADPIAALVMLPIIVSEGREALRGEHCSDCH